MVDRRRSAPKPETVAFAKRGPARPKTYGSFMSVPIEAELSLTRTIARRLFNLLSVRHPSLLDEIVSEWEVAPRATVDREFEATLLLFERHSIDVVPCRKILYDQDPQSPSFVLTRPSGDVEIVDSAKLLMLAGLDAE